MPKAALERRHFDLLIRIVDNAMDVAVLEENIVWEELNELRKLLEYTKHFKHFTVEIDDDDTGS